MSCVTHHEYIIIINILVISALQTLYHIRKSSDFLSERSEVSIILILSIFCVFCLLKVLSVICPEYNTAGACSVQLCLRH